MTIYHAPRPLILEEIDATRHTVIEASAGTGKTYTLQHLVVELVVAHAIPLEQILVVTFTDKATREMRERVRATLRATLHPAHEPAADESRWTIDAAARRRLEEALATFDRAPISTIHAFCQRVLTENAFECARLLRQEQVQARDVFGRAFREELRLAMSATSPLRPSLERAIALYGVSKLEADLFHWFRERGAPEPSLDVQVALAAFQALPTPAELEPGAAVANALEQALSRQPKKTVPRLLSSLAPLVERARAEGDLFEVLPAFWDWAAAGAPGRKTQLAYVRHYLGGKDELASLAQAIEVVGQMAGTPLSVLVSELLPRVTLRLAGRKAERGWFDFDDMLTLLRDALYSAGSEGLVGELRRRYRVALVDEFQDTDRVQWDIFSRVFFESGDGHSLIVIGDPKQAIYGFRNADVHTYHAAREAILEQGGGEVPLVRQFRSRRPVVDAVNRILSTDFFSGLNSYRHPVECGRPELRALDESGRDAVPVTLFHLIGRPSLNAKGARRVLGERIAREVRRLLDGGLRVDRGHGPVPLVASDIHVLCRSGDDAAAVVTGLARERIPHARYKQEGLFQTDAARDIWVLLRALEDPRAPAKRLDAWLTPFFAVPLERIERCREVPPDHPLTQSLTRWAQLADAQRWAALFRALLEESGLIRRELFAGIGERNLTDHQHIFEVLLEETHRGRRTLSQLIARLAAFIDKRELPAGESGNVHRLESERRAVQVLTMHKAKGLEAEVVFLVGGLGEPSVSRLAPRVYHDPSGQRRAWIGAPTAEIQARMDAEKREEAERLLYVALTRARSRLYLPYFGPPPPPLARDSAAGEDTARALRLATGEGVGAGEGVARPGAQEPVGEERVDQYEMKGMNGPYRVLNERLEGLVAAGVTADPASTGFERIEVIIEPAEEVAVPPEERLDLWLPPPALIEDAEDDGADFGRLRAERRGLAITSYTRMKSAVGGYRAPARAEGVRAEGVNDEGLVSPIDTAAPGQDELPGGNAMGVFLHEVLEHLPFERDEALSSSDALLADPVCGPLISARARAQGVDERWLPQAAVLLIEALSCRLELADGSVLSGGLRTVTARSAELTFLQPIPEASSAPLDEAASARGAEQAGVERGYIRGVIDLVFRTEGRFHVADYKSDRLPRYDQETITRHVEENYMVQARLYAIGALRTLAIHDAETYDRAFGGIAYLFLRGMNGEGDGVWTARPRFDEVVAWERELLQDRPWGYPLPPRRASRPPKSRRQQ